MPRLASLFASADDLLVDAIAQAPWCVQPTSQDIVEAYRLADERGFDVLPVREVDGEIRKTITKNQLNGVVSWENVLAGAVPLTADRLVARESPALRLLDRLGKGQPLFTLGTSGVDGIVTIYDLNQPAAHLLAFGLALICESDLAEFLRDKLGDDPWTAYKAARDALQRDFRGHARKRESSGLRRWRHMQSDDHHVHVASTLSFGEKIGVVEALAADPLARQHDVCGDDLITELRLISSLRNAIGHPDEDNPQLEDAEWVFRGIRAAEHYARRVIDRANG